MPVKLEEMRNLLLPGLQSLASDNPQAWVRVFGLAPLKAEGSGDQECEARGCKENAVAFNDDGEALCEDCMAEWALAYSDEG